MAVCNTQTPVIGSVKSIEMLRKRSTALSHQKHRCNKNIFRCAKNYHSVGYHLTRVVSYILGISLLVHLSSSYFYDASYNCVYIFSGFWLPGPAPMIDDEVHVNATKPLQISDHKWQLRLTMNGTNIQQTIKNDKK